MKGFEKELDFAKTLAKKAGKIYLQNFAKSKRKIKANNTPVTETDIAVSHLVQEEVKRAFPTYLLLDEELNHNYSGEAGHLWVCDPVDGTIPFSHNIPTSMFSLALCLEGRPVLGVLYDPYMDRLYHAVSGSGAFLNNKQIKVNERKLTPGETLFFIPNWLDRDVSFDYNKFISLCHEKKLVLSSVESFVYLSALVAEGVIAGTLMPSANPWDRAAALCIVREAGAVVIDEKGLDAEVFGNSNFCIAAPPENSKQILELLNQAIA